VVRTGPYHGVQLASDPDPFYYRPDLDAPQHPGLLRRAGRPFVSPGVRAPIHPVLGDHDILVAGELVRTEATRALAVGNQALWELPPGLSLPPGTQLTAGGSPDGPPLPGLVDSFLAQALAGPKVRVPSDPSRHQLTPAEAIHRLRAGTSGTLDYVADVGRDLRLIVLDLARRAGGSGGLVRPDQPGWLASQLDGVGERWVIVVSHQPLASSKGGDALLSLMDSHPRVIAALAGHTHRNSIEPRGHYWLINTASLIDYPQQGRALRVVRTAGGGIAIQTWMLDHTGSELAAISRQLAYLDAQGGRPKGFAGRRLDRNVTLYLRG
jgi:hypothetical protein